MEFLYWTVKSGSIPDTPTGVLVVKCRCVQASILDTKPAQFRQLLSVTTNALTWRQSFLLRFVKKEKGEMLMMRAMLLCLAVAFVVLFVYFGIHYAKDVGREIKNTLKKLFG